MRILIAGCGYVGLRLADRLNGLGHQVFGLRRNPEGPLPFLIWCRGDLTSTEPLLLPERIDAVVLAAGLRRDADERYQALFVDGYARLLETLRHTSLKRLVMVSTTGVFAEADGAWVTEASPVDSSRSPSRYYLDAEQQVLDARCSSVVVRLSGIYGPERFRLIREVREGRAVICPPPAHYLNHLHADDAAGAIAHLVTLADPEPLYIASDREPADRNTVLQWIADELGAGELPLDPRPEARPGRRSGNKRCDASRLLASGYTFAFPTFREGYRDLMARGLDKS